MALIIRLPRHIGLHTVIQGTLRAETSTRFSMSAATQYEEAVFEPRTSHYKLHKIPPFATEMEMEAERES